LIVSRKKVDPSVFVNPYGDKLPQMNPKLNPYITSYDTKKTKSVKELIMDRFKKSEPIVLVKENVVAPSVEPQVVYYPPSFLHDMKEMFAGDLLFVASKFPKHKKRETIMTANEIRQACENIKWQ
jgi:hypothetical protein